MLDARAADRFTGEVTMVDPRPGHIPGARSAPATDVFAADGRFKSVDALREHYAARGVDSSLPPMSSPTAAPASAPAPTCSRSSTPASPPARLYVASWSGWSADPERPAALGT